MLLCSQLVENVQGQDAKLFQATQVVDEARHNEVLQRYLELRLDGESYPLGGNVKEIFDTLLGTSSWHLKTIGLQLVAETFAVSLFRMLAETSKDAVLRQVCRRILQDEARHMGFAMLSLPDDRRRGDRGRASRDGGLRRVGAGPDADRHLPAPVFQEMGFGEAEIKEIKHPARAGGRRRRDRLPQVVPPRPAWRPGAQPPQGRAADRADPPRLQSVGISLAAWARHSGGASGLADRADDLLGA